MIRPPASLLAADDDEAVRVLGFVERRHSPSGSPPRWLVCARPWPSSAYPRCDGQGENA